MEELKTRIDDCAKLSKDEMKALFDDIIALDDLDDRYELISRFLNNMREHIVNDSVSNLMDRNQISETIDELKDKFKELTNYTDADIVELFKNVGLDIDNISNDVMEKLEASIGVLESELSDVEHLALNNGVITEQYLQNEIKRLEDEKSAEIKLCNEQIEKLDPTGLKRKSLSELKDICVDLVTRRNMLQSSIRSVGVDDEVVESGLDEIKKLDEELKVVESEIELRNKFYDKTNEELQQMLQKKIDRRAELETIFKNLRGVDIDENALAEFHRLGDEIQKLQNVLEQRGIYFDKTNEELQQMLQEKIDRRAELETIFKNLGGVDIDEDALAEFHRLGDEIQVLQNILEQRGIYFDKTNEELEQIIQEKIAQSSALRASLQVVEVDNDDVSEASLEEINRLEKEIEEIRNVLKQRKDNPYFFLDKYKKLAELTTRIKKVQSVSDKKVEELKKQLQNLKQLNKMKDCYNDHKKENRFRNADEEHAISKKEHRKDLWYKGLAAAGGVIAGLALSSVPGVGTIRMVIAGTKLATSAINMWTKKHPEGKVAKFVNGIETKFKEKHPKISAVVGKTRDKLKQLFANEKVNWFVNGVAAGYMAGNIIESLTGETIGQHLFGGNDSTQTIVEATNTLETAPTEEPTIPEVTEPEVPITETIPSEDIVNGTLDQADNLISGITLEPGQVFDISGISEGLVSSTSTDAVNLITEAGKEAVVDQFVTLPNGEVMVHFKQINGAGYAWFKESVVKEYLAKAAELASNVGKSL